MTPTLCLRSGNRVNRSGAAGHVQLSADLRHRLRSVRNGQGQRPKQRLSRHRCPPHLHEPLRRAQVIGTEPVRMQAAHRSMASTADKAGCASSHPGNWSRTTSSIDVRTHCARSIGAGASPRPGPIPRPSTTARLPSPARAHHFRLADHDRSALRPFRDPTAQHHRLHETGRLHHEPALGQTRALVFDLRRLACLPSTAAWFPRAGEQGAGVLGRAPNHLCDRQEDPA